MARSVFFSFHYQRDIVRVNQNPGRSLDTNAFARRAEPRG
jgi:hypothetical protein